MIIHINLTLTIREKMIRNLLLSVLILCVSFCLFSGSTWAAKSYRIGVPKNYIAPPYQWFFKALARKNLVIGKNLEIVTIDLSDHQSKTGKEKIRQEIATKCDLFFSTGDDLDIIFQVEITSPLLFFAISDLNKKIPESMRRNTTGIYRETKAELFKQLMQILPEGQRKKIGLIYCQGGKLEKIRHQFTQISNKLEIELITKSFVDTSEIGQVMQEFHNEKATAIMLLPPALCTKEDLSELIVWQKKLKLPIIGQVKEQIKHGILGGPTMDSRQIAPNLADYAAKILQGRSPHQLPIKFFGSKYVINLDTASQLGTIIPQEIVEQAEIVGMGSPQKTIKKNKIHPVAGNFSIGVPKNLPAPLLKSLLNSLGKKGYYSKKNLHLVPFTIKENSSLAQLNKLAKDLSDKTDLIFTNGTSLISLKKMPTISSPVCFISTKELTANIPQPISENFTGVIRASVLSLMDMIHQMLPAKQHLALMTHYSSDMTKIEDEYIKAAQQYNLILDFHYFNNEEEIEKTMRQIAEHDDFVLLYPPGITNRDIDEIVKWQNQLHLPVLSQLEKHIKAGLLGGPTTDLQKVSTKLAEYIDKILQGREPSHLPYFYYQSKYTINLRAANILKQDIPTEITGHADIIH